MERGSEMYSFTSRIRYSETDEHSYLTAEGVLDYFQDCSSFEGEDIGLGVDYLKKHKIVWILSAWQIVIERYPKLGDEIEVFTFPHAFKSCFGFRNYVMKDMNGEVLAYANSVWTLMSTENHKPVKPNNLMKELYLIQEPFEMNYAPRKIEISEGGEIREKIEVKPNYIDSNNHVNNGRYISVAFEVLKDEDVVSEESVGQIRAQYKMEAHLGDEIYPRVINGENTVVISLEDAEGTPYAIVELKGKE